MSDIDVDELAREVEIFLAGFIPKVTTFSLRNNDGADEALGRP